MKKRSLRFCFMAIIDKKIFLSNCVNSGVRDSINDKFICLECTSRVAKGNSEAVRQALLSGWELLKHHL
jgi:hypothetical protein